jgi:hypothetical protein
LATRREKKPEPWMGCKRRRMQTEEENDPRSTNDTTDREEKCRGAEKNKANGSKFSLQRWRPK